MSIKRILTPLLVLSFATGLYNPIKAAEYETKEQEPQNYNNTASAVDQKSKSVSKGKEETAAPINVFLKVDSKHIDKAQQQNKLAFGRGNVGEGTVASKQLLQLIQERCNIIQELISQLDQVSKSDRNNNDEDVKDKQVGCILMELPQECITEEGLEYLDYWFRILKDDGLVQSAKLVITGFEEKKQNDTQVLLEGLVAKKKLDLFFTKSAQNDDNTKFTLDAEKIIYGASFEVALSNNKEALNKNKGTSLEKVNKALKQQLEKQKVDSEKDEVLSGENKGDLVFSFSGDGCVYSFEKQKQKVDSEKDEVLSGENRGHLVFSFSGDGCVCSFVSAKENSDPEPIQKKPSYNITELKASFEKYSNQNNDKKICSIVLQVSEADVIIASDSDKHLLLLAAFFVVFGDQSLKDYLICLMITGNKDVEKVTQKKSLEKILNPGVENVFFVNGDANSIKFGDEKIIWCEKDKNINTQLPQILEATQNITNDKIKDALTEIEQLLDDPKPVNQGIITAAIIVAIVIIAYGVYHSYKHLFGTTPATDDKKSKDSVKGNIANSTKQQQVPDTSGKSPSADTTAAASNSSNRPGWGFQEWLLLIISVILVVAGGYWYFRIQKKS